MEHFPALNADCFDQQIAERLQLEAATHTDPVWLGKRALLQSFRRRRSGTPADGDGSGSKTV